MSDARLGLENGLLTAEEVAQRVKVPKSSVYDYRRRRHDPLPWVRIGRHVRFYLPAVEAWVARQATVGCL